MIRISGARSADFLSLPHRLSAATPPSLPHRCAVRDGAVAIWPGGAHPSRVPALSPQRSAAPTFPPVLASDGKAPVRRDGPAPPES